MADTYEQNLGQKTLVTAEDYIRVVGTDNVSYKQQIKSVPSQYVVQSGTDLLAYIKTLGTGTYFVRMDNVSGLPSGGVVYRIVKTHGINDARASIVAIPMNATANIYTTFITSASATSITWTAQPTRAEIDALNSNTAHIGKVVLAKEIQLSTSASVTLENRHIYLVVGAHPYTAGCAYVVAGWENGAARVTPILANSNVALTMNSFTLTISMTANATMWIRVLDLGEAF